MKELKLDSGMLEIAIEGRTYPFRADAAFAERVAELAEEAERRSAMASAEERNDPVETAAFLSYAVDSLLGDGTVEAVYEDDILGHTVVVRHDGGYVTRYASLGEDVAVAAGETVTLGQTLGSVGSSALLETALGSHLHFAVTCRDQPMDPAAFLALGSETEYRSFLLETKHP